MARGANMMGWAMLVVVVMALYVGKAQGATGVCAVDCTREKKTGWGDLVYAAIGCFGECLHYSGFNTDPDTVKPSPQLQKALELLAQAPEVQENINVPSLGRKALAPMIYQDFHL
ncbi:hypothetical protein MKW94_025613 [Papaver nudicaule]|uniref:Uncharacterized protein n=1 Tax=Papaver nudicaule TaxID=74823 RepID=A0AA41VNC5_PAPNU|nr:hypothetical protein [Papaver nudicaule]